jgi:hypothetical protein
MDNGRKCGREAIDNDSVITYGHANQERTVAARTKVGPIDQTVLGEVSVRTVKM